MLYAAGHKETGVGNKRLIRTIDGVGGFTGLSFFNDQNNMYTAKIHSIMLKLLPEGPWLATPVDPDIRALHGGRQQQGKQPGRLDQAARIAARCRATPAFRLQPGDALLLFFKDNVPLTKTSGRKRDLAI